MNLRRAPGLMVLAYALLLAAYVGGNAPFTSPDEWAHYLRSLGIAQGVFLGDPARYPPGTPGLDPARLAWVNQATREVPVPAGLSPGGYGCSAGQADESAACQDQVVPHPQAREEITAVGTYQPLFYLPPAAVILQGPSPPVALGLARAVSALVVLGFLGMGVACLWGGRPGGLDLVGPLLAVTPMVLFVGASLNTSGPEIAASMALGAAVLRMSGDGDPPAWVWGALAVSGAATALSRSPGPLWVAFYGLLFVALGGPRDTLRLVRARPGRALGTAALIALGLALSLGWELTYGPDTVADITPLGPTLAEAVRIRGVVWQAVGVFGYLETGLPQWIYDLWLGMVIAAVLAALVVGTIRERLVLAVTVLAAPGVGILMFAAVYRHSGFGQQGRHLLPLLVAVPLVAGWILSRRAQGAGAWRHLLPLLGLGAATAHGMAWWRNARRHAVGGDGPIWFLSAPEWDPAGGWLPWVALAALGVVAMLAATWIPEAEGAPPYTRDRSRPSEPA